MVGLGLSAFVLLIPIFSSVAHAGRSFYITDQSARAGMIMSLTQNEGVAEPTNTENAATAVGVLDPSKAEFDMQPGQVNVQTEGTSATLVSTLNGDINVGDKIGVSSLTGLGAKLTGTGWVVGIAQGSFETGSNGAVKSSATDSSGNKQEVYVGSIPVSIKVMYFNNQTGGATAKSVLPENLQQIVDSLAGRRASQTAVVLAFILLLAGFVIAGLIVYAAVSQAIRATARQPLAKQAVMRRMLQACAVALAILGASLLSASIVIRIL